MKAWARRVDHQSRHKRQQKIELLPLPLHIRDSLSLEYHLHLESLRAGLGSLISLQILMRVALAGSMLEKMGYGQSISREFEVYEGAANEAYSNGEEGSYKFSDWSFRLFAKLVTIHDWQLRTAPLRVIDQIAKRIEQE